MVGRWWYESAAQHNGWTADARLANFGLFLAGPAKKWFKNTRQPDAWLDTLGVGGAAGVQGITSAYYPRRLMDKLHNRKQGSVEPLLHYYYDTLDMCKNVNMDMSEADIIDHLLAGLRPSLVKKLVPLELATCEDLLEKAKLFIRAEEMTSAAQGECGRRPSEMGIGGAEGVAAAPGRSFEELLQHWLQTWADTAERAVGQHRGMISDLPLLTLSPVATDVWMEKIFEIVHRFER